MTTTFKFLLGSALILALAACGDGADRAAPDAKGGRADAAGAGGPGGPGGPGQKGGRSGGDRTPVVTLGQVKPHEFLTKIEAVGTANAYEQVSITANVTERIKSLNFNDGQFVQRGQVLVVMSQGEEAAGLNESRARLREAEQQLERTRALLKDGWATRARLDSAVAARDAARADVAVLQARVEDRVIRAPFSGVVGLRRVSPGLVAGAGTEILTLTDVSRIKLDFTVPETQLGGLMVGQEVRAKAAAYGNEEFIGRLEGIDPQINPTTRAASVRAVIPNASGRLKAGMLLTVAVVQSKRTALAVPEQAVVALRDERAVFRVDPDSMDTERVVIATGAREPGFVEITGGIPEGATIVVDGTVKVRDGGKVRVLGQERGPRGPQTAQAPGAPANP